MGRIILTICGAVVALGLMAALPPPQDQGRGEQDSSQQQGSQSANNPNPVAVPSAVEDRGCANRQDDRSSDLCAQWKAADAAREAADWASRSFWVGLIGTGLLIWTLWETRRISQREQRAYIRIDHEGGTIVPGKPVSITLKVVNYGATPARDVAFQSGCLVRPDGWDWADEPDPPVEDKGRTFITVHPDSPVAMSFNMDETLSEATHQHIMAGRSKVYARGTLFYRDVFGRKRETRIQVEFSGKDGNTKIQISGRGNTAT